MYNRYIPNNIPYEPVRDFHSAPGQSRKNAQHPPPPPTKGKTLLDGVAGGLSGLLKQIHLEKLDGGDILLILILLFLFYEQDDNLEAIITLGLLLIFGLFTDEDNQENQESFSPTT